jgi:membrane-bound inhibitor of C-type lysozyme
MPHHGCVLSWCQMFTIIFDNIGEQKKDLGLLSTVTLTREVHYQSTAGKLEVSLMNTRFLSLYKISLAQLELLFIKGVSDAHIISFTIHD